MYPNLKAEMSRNNIKQKDIAEGIEKDEYIISLKINGKRGWFLDEAKKIKTIFFPELSIEYLFMTSEELEKKKGDK